MEVNEFVRFCQEVHDANYEADSIEQVENAMFLRSIYIGYMYPRCKPPETDETAIEGYRLGRDLSEPGGVEKIRRV